MSVGTWTCTKQYMADTGGNGTNPGDLHIPLGKWAAGTGLTWIGRAALYAPISFSGMVTITNAKLYLLSHTAAGYHANGTGTNSFYPRRKSVDWSETSGGASSAIDETWGGGGAAVVTTGFYGDECGASSINSDVADVTWVTIDITEIAQAWLAGAANYGVMIFAGGESSTADAFEAYSRHAGSKPYIQVTYTTNQAPNAPVSLSPTGGAIRNTGTSIVVSGTRSDPDSGDYITGVDLRMYTQADVLLDSDTYYPTGTPTTFSRTMTVPAGNASYKWLARTRDKSSVWGPWSASQSFIANTIPNAPIAALVESPALDLKTLTPSFSVVRSDADATDKMSGYEVNVQTIAGIEVWYSSNVVSPSAASISKLYSGPALTWQTAYRWQALTKDVNGAWGPATVWYPFTTHTTGVPISLDPTGSEVVGLTPTLTGSRATSDDTIVSYQIQAYESDGVTLKWDSGTLTTGITGGSSFSKAYAGAALSYSTTYKWRALVTGSIGGTSAYSSLKSFVTSSASDATQTAPLGTPITTLTPTFTGAWSDNLNGYQIILYAADGTTVVWDSTMLTVGSATTYSKLYNGTALTWLTSYKWKIRVRRNSDNVVQAYSGKVAFTTDSAGTAALTAPISNSWQTTLTPTFTGTTFGAETISTFRILLYEADGTTLTWDSGELAGSGTSFSKVYNGASALVRGRSYKWQARYTKTGGAIGNYTAQGSFHVNALPLGPSVLIPETGFVLADSLLPTFSAVFQDADVDQWTDYPTLMEIEVRNNATDALIATQSNASGLVVGQNDIVWDGTPALAYDTTYKWRARFTDSKSEVGDWSSFVTIKPSHSSTVAITGPVATIVSPTVTVAWTYGSTSSKAQGSYQVTVERNSDEIIVYDSGVVLSAAASHVIPAGYLVNGTEYTISLSTADIEGI